MVSCKIILQILITPGVAAATDPAWVRSWNTKREFGFKCEVRGTKAESRIRETFVV
jgi:hypothetical protein